jgi:hypothetical protein
MVLLAALGACAGEPECVSLPEPEAPGSCTPEYEPDFDAVYANTFTSCALATACHGQGSPNGLDLGPDADSAYEALLGGDYVVPGEPGCGEVSSRLGDGTMPPGAPLSAAELCAVRTWIAAGAER